MASTARGRLERPHRHAAPFARRALRSQAPRPSDALDAPEGSERTSWYVSVPGLLPRWQGQLSRAPDGICVPT